MDDLFGAKTALDVAGSIRPEELIKLVDLLFELNVDKDTVVTIIAETEFRLQRSHHEILQLGWMVVELRNHIRGLLK